MLTTQMENALRYYTGDVSWALSQGYDTAFWGDPKGYGTLNSIFFPGISNEQARIAEKKPLNPEFLSDAERLLTLCETLIEASRIYISPRETKRVFRVERISNFTHTFQAGYTVAFTSTSRDGFLAEYQDKKGLVLLTYELSPGVAHVDMQQALSYYLKKEEAEILLPPFLPITFTRRPLQPGERQIRDYDGNPPEAAYWVQVRPWESSNITSSPSLAPEDALAGQRVLRALMEDKIPTPSDVTAYIRWKKAFCCQLRMRCHL